jgi:hypothetical protein
MRTLFECSYWICGAIWIATLFYPESSRERHTDTGSRDSKIIENSVNREIFQVEILNRSTPNEEMNDDIHHP